MNMFDQLSREDRELFAEVLAAGAPDLIPHFLTQTRPTTEQAHRVESAFADSLEFVGDDYTPTERTLRIEGLIGRYHRLWPLYD